MNTRIFHRPTEQADDPAKSSALRDLFVTIVTLSIMAVLIALVLVVVFAGAGAAWSLLSMAFDFGFGVFTC